MSKAKSYINVDEFITMLKKFHPETETNLYIGQYVNITFTPYNQKVEIVESTGNYNAICLWHDKTRSINELIHDLSKINLIDPKVAIAIGSIRFILDKSYRSKSCHSYLTWKWNLYI